MFTSGFIQQKERTIKNTFNVSSFLYELTENIIDLYL